MDKDYKNKELVLKTIRFEPQTIEKINKMAEESERNFTEQVRFIIKEYIRMKENN